MLAYHSAAPLHVVEVSVSVSAEVHTGGDPGERSPLPLSQTAVWRPLLMFHLWMNNMGVSHCLQTGGVIPQASHCTSVDKWFYLALRMWVIGLSTSMSQKYQVCVQLKMF